MMMVWPSWTVTMVSASRMATIGAVSPVTAVASPILSVTMGWMCIVTVPSLLIWGVTSSVTPMLTV